MFFSYAGAQVSVDLRKSESDVDKGPYLHVSTSGLVAAEDMQLSNSEIAGMLLFELVAQYLTLLHPLGASVWLWTNSTSKS